MSCLAVQFSTWIDDLTKLISRYINIDHDTVPLMSLRLGADTKMNFDKKKAFSNGCFYGRMINWVDTLFNWRPWSVSS